MKNFQRETKLPGNFCGQTKKLSGIMNSFSDFQFNGDKLPWIKMRMLLSME